LVAEVKKWTKIPIEIHCHNNWGFATASTLAGVTAGGSRTYLHQRHGGMLPG
jgi:isopropylmalate/homocitrate/citramalate synthase